MCLSWQYWQASFSIQTTIAPRQRCRQNRTVGQRPEHGGCQSISRCGTSKATTLITSADTASARMLATINPRADGGHTTFSNNRARPPTHTGEDCQHGLFIEEKSSCHGCNTKNKPKGQSVSRNIAHVAGVHRETTRENHHPERHGIAQDCHLPRSALTSAHCARPTIPQVCNRAMVRCI